MRGRKQDTRTATTRERGKKSEGQVMKYGTTPDVSKLKTEIAVLEGILREKKEQLRIAEAIEKQKDDLWRKHVVGGSPPKSTTEDDEV